MLALNLAISSAMLVLTVFVHFVGLAAYIAILRAEFAVRLRARSWGHRAATILLVVLGLAWLHTIEIWLFAALYLALGQFREIEPALYFSTVTFTTVGFGDTALSQSRRIIGAIEAANGFILIGWSTAFLVSVTAKMGLLEAQLERDPHHRPQTSRQDSLL